MPVNLFKKNLFHLFFFLTRDFTKKFDALFRLEEIHGSLKLSPIYLKKVNQWLNNDETLLEQIKQQVIKNLLFYKIKYISFKACY